MTLDVAFLYKKFYLKPTGVGWGLKISKSKFLRKHFGVEIK
jgi:hypothetical protein